MSLLEEQIHTLHEAISQFRALQETLPTQLQDIRDTLTTQQQQITNTGMEVCKNEFEAGSVMNIVSLLRIHSPIAIKINHFDNVNVYIKMPRCVFWRTADEINKDAFFTNSIIISSF